MTRDFPLVGGADRVEDVRRWHAEGGTRPVVPARPASTVVLVRDAPDGSGPLVWMVHRAATMAFAASMHAFPGGGVAEEDGARPLATETVATLATAMASPVDTAWRHLAAAVREVEEETGLVLAPERLRPRSHWVTPVFDRRRFDAWIFAAAVADDEEPETRGTEAQTMSWLRPSEVLRGWVEGEVMMMPPTVVALEEVAAAGSSAAYLALPADARVVLPYLTEADGDLVVRAELS